MPEHARTAWLVRGGFTPTRVGAIITVQFQLQPGDHRENNSAVSRRRAIRARNRNRPNDCANLYTRLPAQFVQVIWRQICLWAAGLTN